MYKPVMTSLGVIFTLATVTLLVLGIWVEDARFYYTAIVSGMLTAGAWIGLVGA